MNNINFKQLNNCFIKTLYPIDKFEEGEVIAKFDKIQVAGLQEINDFVSANGGYGNKARIFWNTPKELNLQFSQGVFSNTQLAIALNSKICSKNLSEGILLTRREVKESNENGEIELKDIPYGKIFVYTFNEYKKINFSINENILNITTPFQKIICDYEYFYYGNNNIIKIGQEYLSGFVSFTGETIIKDDETGITTTGIIKIPKMRIKDSLNIYLGQNTSPIVLNFSAVGVLSGNRNNSYVAELIFLDSNINADF